MLHRYVVLVSTAIGGPAYETARRRVQARFGTEDLVVDSRLAACWVFQAAPSRLGHRRLAQGGCVIGFDVHGAERPAEFIDRTWGAYVVLGVDAAQGAVTVLRDPSGRIACWRLRLDGVDVLFSDYQDVYWLQAAPCRIDWDYLVHYLNQDWLQGEATCVEGVTEVLPGEELRYVRERPPVQTLRWRPHEIAAGPHASLHAAQDALRKAGEASVAAWAGRYGRVSIDLSGGLDSAIVLGLLRDHAGPADVTGLNIVTPGAEGDERIYARAVAQRHGVPLAERLAPVRDLDFKPSAPRRLLRPAPTMIPSGYGQVRTAFARESAAEAVFTGMGGDHVFALDLQVEALDDYLHNGGGPGDFLGTAAYLAQLSRNTVWAAFGGLARRRFGPTPRPQDQWPPESAFLSAEAKAGADYGRYLHPWAKEALGLAPAAKLRQIAALVHLQKLYKRVGRAEICEEVHVLLAQPMLEASLRTPAHWFGVGGVPRGLARRAFADILPDLIRERRSKGGSIAYFVQFAVRRLPEIRGLLLDGRLAARGLLDRPRLEATLTPLALSANRDFHPLFRCLMTELWVRQTEDDQAAARAEQARAPEPA